MSVNISEMNEVPTEETIDIKPHKLEFFMNSRLFSHLSIECLRKIIIQAKPLTVSAGQIIIHKGDINNNYYIIKSGICEVVNTSLSGEGEVVTLLEKGNAFGEEALISKLPSNVTVRMKTDALLLFFNKNDFDNLIKTPVLKKIDMQELLRANELGSQIIDVRSEGKYKEAHVKGSINIPNDSFNKQLYNFNQSKHYIVYSDNAINSSICAFKLMQKGYSAAYLDDGIYNNINSHEILPLVPQNNNKYLNPLNNKNVGQSEIKFDQYDAIVSERDQLSAKLKRFEEIVRNTLNTQKMFIEERQKIKQNLAGTRQAIRNELRFMIDEMNTFINLKKATSVDGIAKDKLIETLMSFGELAVSNAKKINFKTQLITSSSKVLAQINQETIKNEQRKVTSSDVVTVSKPTRKNEKVTESKLVAKSDKKLDKGEQSKNSEPSNDKSKLLHAVNTFKKSMNIVDLDIESDIESFNKDTSEVKVRKVDDSVDDDFLKRYERTMWKVQDLKRLQAEMDQTHVNIDMSDIEEMLKSKE